MDRDKLERISATLGNVSGVMAELTRQVHPSHGSAANLSFFQGALQREGEKLRLDGFPQLADGLRALREEIGETSNG